MAENTSSGRQWPDAYAYYYAGSRNHPFCPLKFRLVELRHYFGIGEERLAASS